MRKLIFICLLFPSIVLAERKDLRFISRTPTVDTSAYAAKDDIGGLMEFAGLTCPGTKTGSIVGLTLTDKSDNATEYDVVLFKSNPSTSTITDQAAFDPSDADLSKMLPVVNIETTDHFSFNDNGISSVSSLASRAWSTTGTFTDGTIYAALVSRGTPTYAASADITLMLIFECD